MEDFDYIDKLAQQALSNRTAEPSAEGWNVVQQKMKRKKRKRFLIYMVLLALLCSLGVFIGILSTENSDTSTVSNNKTEQSQENKVNNNTNTTSNSTATSSSSSGSSSNSSSDSNSNSSSDSISNSTAIANDDSQAEIDTAVTTSNSGTSVTSNTFKTQKSTTNNVHGEQNGLVQTKTAHHSRLFEKDKDSEDTNASTKPHFSYETSQMDEKAVSTFFTKDGGFDTMDAAGLKLYPWELIAPDTLKKKRKKKQTTKKDEKIYEQLDVMVGLNGFARPNDYDFTGSYVVELSYTDEKKLKKDYFFKYGMSLQFRNLRFKKDSISFNKGELSINIHSGVEKRFGNFGIEAGPYLGYELHSPNNEFFKDDSSNFFEEKINYGLYSTLYYRRFGLVFKYEFSPYINYLGDKKFGAFTIGIKYDF